MAAWLAAKLMQQNRSSSDKVHDCRRYLHHLSSSLLPSDLSVSEGDIHFAVTHQRQELSPSSILLLPSNEQTLISACHV
jgi:hypothetical protein